MSDQIHDNAEKISKGGVKPDAIPKEYPKVPDGTEQTDGQPPYSGNYYPDERTPWLLEKGENIPGEIRVI